MSRQEREYQPGLIKRIEILLPGAYVRKVEVQQGWPDLLILWHNCWAFLEVKRKRPTSERDFQPNQPWWIEELNSMSFAACIYPENEEDVLNDLQQALKSYRSARAIKR